MFVVKGEVERVIDYSFTVTAKHSGLAGYTTDLVEDSLTSWNDINNYCGYSGYSGNAVYNEFATDSNGDNMYVRTVHPKKLPKKGTRTRARYDRKERRKKRRKEKKEYESIHHKTKEKPL
jgi:hypothetical protein